MKTCFCGYFRFEDSVLWNDRDKEQRTERNDMSAKYKIFEM